jgi:hypothetical protein
MQAFLMNHGRDRRSGLWVRDAGDRVVVKAGGEWCSGLLDRIRGLKWSKETLKISG